MRDICHFAKSWVAISSLMFNFSAFFRVLSSIGWPALYMWPATLPTCQQLARPTCQWKATASPWPDSCAAASLACPTSSTRPRSGPTWATWTQSSGRRLTDSSETFPSRRSSTKSTKLFSKISSRTRSMTHQSWTDQGNKSKPKTITKPTKDYLDKTTSRSNWQKTKAACSLKVEASAEVTPPPPAHYAIPCQHICFDRIPLLTRLMQRCTRL